MFRRLLACCALTSAQLAAATLPARADNVPESIAQFSAATLALLESHEYGIFGLMCGILLFAAICGVALVRARGQVSANRAAYQLERSALQGELYRTRALLGVDPQVFVTWQADGEAPDVTGNVTVIAPPDEPRDVHVFDDWLETQDALAIAHAVDTLRQTGAGFEMALTTLAGKQIAADGRIIGGCAVLRLREVGGIARELAELSSEYRKLQNHVHALGILTETISMPLWVRDEAGRLTFVNQAYAKAVESTPAEVVAHGTELLDHGAREELRMGAAAGTPYLKRFPAVIAGSRRSLDVLNVPTGRGSTGIGIDATEAENLRLEVARMIEAHRSTLDQLATAVAIFDNQRHLTFYNTAYAQLWDLDASFLDQNPTDSAVLDRLRAARRLPEQHDFRPWRAQLHEAYQAVEPRQHEWHLPDGRTLRVVTTPNPEGGVTYLFDNLTERLDLERRFDAVIRVQGETLDNLGEAVAVFSSDGRLRLSNPAFAQMWRLDPIALLARPHIESVIANCRKLTTDDEPWHALRTAVTALDNRSQITRRFEQNDGGILDCAALPLPDGGTLVTFRDISATVHFERALVERNEALIAGEKLKEAFLEHMSYELRSPLTNIIGFTYFLGDGKTGPLNERQREYLGYITSSTNALMAIVDNILDLATIEAGAMTLDLSPVGIIATMEAAAAGVQDRLIKDEITLDIRANPDVGNFIADERRVRQVLFNLLSNAVGFSPRGGSVTLTATRPNDTVVFKVVDRGPGIPDDMKDKVFTRFTSDPRGSEHRGVGLGLSLVRSFVELHGGTVEIDSDAGRGTVVTCVFPARAEATTATSSETHAA
ncbi:MAG TPA: PAS-domain containing protein [Xanthobacteraceae bacterium]|nr:PAS-domain containing protein [Xanthobacteraceae bacterium]